ncbi:MULTISPECIES: transglutaminase domain-containing protein [Archaeoglobus]|uniref:Transglutaminase-like domain-containing protein n=1 Tax=Archaeoglobus fulgidus (strain ATCC 49558 / DSM 4304 / JCM 9628 / NBRC 100126 / VC-16) TaxID=224325 RepID=O30313_ARCFU|nr:MULTISPECIES: transglutaminase domain-containing protein [Archaeoglobus]AAB91309.1 predicted coding region AF_2357 [Archaeoglobus fulgidus DSM 4304]MDI3497832.1 hypothetical protein [Archaeoglobus sp.]
MQPKKLVIILLILFCTFIIYNFFTIWYYLIIAPVGESEIKKIVEEVNSTSGTYQKLEKIAKWEGENIAYIYGINPNFSIPSYHFYWINGELKIRALENSGFNGDPRWIAYFKVGGCGELARLFCEAAKRAGFEARVVSDLGYDHAWVEVKINNSWVVADPTVYWLYVNYPEKYPNWNKLWFNNESWANLIDFSRVVTVLPNGSVLDLTSNYTKTYNVTITIDQNVEKGILKVTTWKGSVERTVYSKAVNKSDTVNLALATRIYKFELIVPTWYFLEGYGAEVRHIGDSSSEYVKLKVNLYRETEYYFVFVGLLLGISICFLCYEVVLIYRKLKEDFGKTR